MFSHYATRKISPICKIATFSEDLSFLNLRSHLNKKKKEICPAYISKINSICEKQIIILMIPNVENEGWHYLAVKTICITKSNDFTT